MHTPGRCGPRGDAPFGSGLVRRESRPTERESVAVIVRALEGAVVTVAVVVEAAGVQAEATVSRVFEWIWALGRWWKHQEMLMAGFGTGKKRGKKNDE